MAKRTLTLDIFDYSGNKIVNLYDSAKSMSGEAVDIHKVEERNGWKELSFTLPTTCSGENGEEENYRLQYLIADYKIRFMDDKETDWYIISEPKVTHNNFSKNVNVVAGHVCQLLKTKKLSLEFSDTEGNNIGTAKELLTCILEGTDWNVGNVSEFYETYDPTLTKRRTLTASTQTGAFKLIEMVCELFDAKPIYHGETLYYVDEEERVGQVVDIVPMNPFSKDKFQDGMPVEVLDGDTKVLELHYNRNLKNISRTLNTNNLITKLYAYGSYGTMNGLCSIQTCYHDEYVFILNQAIEADTEIMFIGDSNITYYFVTSNALNEGDKLIWSRLDFSSRSYVWDETNQYAYKVYTEPKKDTWIEMSDVSELDLQSVQNLFPYLMNFTYYDQIGLLKDETFQKVAKFQRLTPSMYATCIDAATDFATSLTNLSKIGNPNTGFLRFAVSGYVSQQDKSTIVTIDTTQGEKGVLYRSDYTNNRKNQFIWHVAEELKADGDPVTGTPSYVLIAHNTNPITWEKAYVKEIWATDKDHSVPYLITNSEGKAGDFIPQTAGETVNPCKLVLWAPMATDNRNRYLPLYQNTDQFFLFCTNSQSGQICSIEVQDEAIINSKIKTSLGAERETHPVYFMDGREGIDTIPSTEVVAINNQYGWYYKYYLLERRKGDLFFCGPKDTSWHDVIISDSKPTVQNGKYLFDNTYRVLYIGSNNEWVEFESSDEKKMAQSFSQVLYYCYKRDELYKGIWDYYYHVIDGNETGNELNYLPAGRYLIDSDYDYYWAFTSIQAKQKNSILKLDSQNKYIYQDDDIGNILMATVIPKYTITKLKNNDISVNLFSEGSLNKNTGAEISVNEFTKDYTPYRSSYIKVYPGEKYILEMPEALLYKGYRIGGVYFYDANKYFRNAISIGDHGTNLTKDGGWFTVPESTGIDQTVTGYKPAAEYIRILWTNIPSSNPKMYVDNYQRKAYLNDNTHTCYTILETTHHGENLIGLNNLMARFINTANMAYLTQLGALQSAQDQIQQLDNDMTISLGLMLREGYWRDDSYVEGDEFKLYNDALDNLEEIGKPEVTYSISFIDQYGSNENMGYSIDGTTDLVPYQDIDISNAVHLVDPDIEANTWAYLDKVDICYDKSWETSIEINTRLSLIGQHSFTDVLSSIADVAKASKAKQSIYDKSAEMNGLDIAGWDTDQCVGETLPYNGMTVDGTTFDGTTINGGNYRGANSEGLNWGGVVLDGTSAGSVTIDGKPVEAAIIYGANVSGVILTGVNFTGAISSGLVSEDTIGKRIKEEMQKIIDEGKLQFQNSLSHWYTDEDTGALIFEEVDGAGNPTGQAYCLSGVGLYRAEKYTEDTGKYDWNLVMNYAGITADSITTGVLRSELIEVNSIKVNQLAADVGQVLDISSNKGLDLFATTDGNKPSGSLKTSDAMIEIHAALPELGKDHAEINILSGGEINLAAGEEGQNNGSINIQANREINIESAGSLNLKSNGKMYVESGAGIDIISGGAINIQSGAKQGIAGQLNLLSTGELNVGANSNINIQAGITEDGIVDLYYGNNYLKFTPVFDDETHVPLNFKYNENGYAVTLNNEFIYIKENDAYKQLKGGTINVNSTNGIDIQSGGSINIRSGANGGVAGELNISSTGGMNIEAGGFLKIRSRTEGNIEVYDLPKDFPETGEDDVIYYSIFQDKYYIWDFEDEEDKKKYIETGIHSGRLEIESNGVVNFESGSALRLGTGESDDDHKAKLVVMSKGEIELSANGKLLLTSEIGDGTSIEEHKYTWNEITISGQKIINAGSETSFYSKEQAYEEAKNRIEDQAEAWLTRAGDEDKTNQEMASEAMSRAVGSLTYSYIGEDGVEYTGGKISINSDNGIEINSGGSIMIGSGASQKILGNIEILSTGRMTIGADGELLVAAGNSGDNGLPYMPGKITIDSTGLLDLKSGSEMRLGVGYNGNTKAKLNVGSTGQIDIGANGILRLAAGVTKSGVIDCYYKNNSGNYIPYTLTFNNDGSPKNFYYEEYDEEAEESGFAYIKINNDKYYLYQRYKRPDVKPPADPYVYYKFKGGQIIVESSNGIIIKSHGSINLMSGAEESVDGKINILSTGEINIESGGKLLLSGGSIHMTTGSTFTVASGNFCVTEEGKIIASSASIAGTIKAKSLYIGNNDTQIKLDSGFLVSSTTTDVSSAIKTTAGIKIDSGVVISTEASDAKGTLRSAAGITVDATTGIVIQSTGNNYTDRVAAIKLANGTIDMSCTNVGASGGNVYISPDGVAIKGDKFSVSSTNFIVTTNGTITAKSGTIGGWTIGSDYLGNKNTIRDSTIGMSTTGFWAGPNEEFFGRLFNVGTDGHLKAKYARLEDASIGAGSGIGGVYFDGQSLYWSSDFHDGFGIGTKDADHGWRLFVGDDKLEYTGKYFIIDYGYLSVLKDGKTQILNATIDKLDAGDVDIQGTVEIVNELEENLALRVYGNVAFDNIIGGKLAGFAILEDLWICNYGTKKESQAGFTRGRGGGLYLFAGHDTTQESITYDNCSFAVKADGSKFKASNCNLSGSFNGSFSGSITSSNVAITGGSITGGKIADFSILSDSATNPTKYICNKTAFKDTQAGIRHGTGGGLTFFAGHDTTQESISYDNCTFAVQATGKFKSTNGTVSSSSSRLMKHNIKNLTFDENIIDKLNPVSFIYNDDKENKTHYGLIHEDTVNLLPAICYDDSGHKSINYVELSLVLLKEVQNLRKRIKKLEGLKE